MKRVNNFKVREQASKCREMTSKCARPKAPQKPVVISPRQMSRPIATANIPNIPGVEQLDEAPTGSARFLGPYFADEIPAMVAAARGLRDRAKHFIAPDGDNFSIFRKPSKP